MTEPVDLPAVVASIARPWEPVDVVTANDTIVRMARLEGAFAWHHHDEDELFLCWEGTFDIEMRDRDTVTLPAGTLYVVPRGVEHRPVAHEPAVTLLIERPETEPYGSR